MDPTPPPSDYPIAGFESAISWCACAGNHAPAAGSTMPPHAGSVPVPLRSHWPSDSPGTFTQRKASRSGLPVVVVGAMPRPRPGGLHQSSGPTHGPWPLRLVSMTKWVVGVPPSGVTVPEPLALPGRGSMRRCRMKTYPAGRIAVVGELSTVADRAMRWIDLKRDVLIRGDDGSGRTSALRDLGRRATAAGINVVAISAFRVPGSPPLAPFLVHELALDSGRTGARPSMAQVVARFADELQGRRNLITVDDIDRLDESSLVVVEELLRRTSVNLAATLVDSTLDYTTAPALDMLASRAPAEVRIPPMTFWEMSALLTEHLQAPPDLALVSTLLTRSAGHAAVALALADAGRWAGCIELEGGLWSEVAPLEDAPHDAVVNVLTRQLTLEQIDGLRTLAWAGPLTVPDAESLIGADVVTALTARRRLTSLVVSGESMVTVSPPALARGLISQLTSAHVRRAVDRLHEHFGSSYVPRPFDAIATAVPELLSGTLLRDGQPQDWASATAGLVLDRLAVRRAARRAAWHADHSVAHAVALLDVLGNTARDDEVNEVFDRTLRTEAPDDPELEERYERYLRAWTRESEPAATDGLSAQERVARDAEQAIEAGRFDDALELIASVEHPTDEVAAELESLRTWALLFGGHLADARRWGQAAMSRAIDELDARAIEVHTSGLVGMHVLAGEYSEAWTPLSLALRLGPPGRFDTLVPAERVLSLAAVLQARMGSARNAWLVLRELERVADARPHFLASLPAWARAETHYCEGEVEQGDELVWRAGLDAAERGDLVSAMVCWTARAEPYTDDQLSTILAVHARQPNSLFAPMVALQRSLTRGPSDSVIRRLPRVAPALHREQVKAVVGRVNWLRTREGRPAMEADEVMLGARTIASPFREPPSDDREPLSERERQVAIFARSGLSNREIASRLFLSVRTVESHMYRALRKLGLRSRAELMTSWDPGPDERA